MNELLNELLGILVEGEVDSSWLSRIDHDGLNGYIIANSDIGYVIKALPEEVFLQWLTAESKGRFFHTKIKNNYIINKVPLNQIMKRITQ